MSFRGVPDVMFVVVGLDLPSDFAMRTQAILKSPRSVSDPQSLVQLAP